jgi:heptosyltransferase-3
MGLPAGEPYAILHPAATYASKQWSPAGFGKMVEFLASEFGLRSVCICGAEEAGILDQVQSAAKEAMIRAAGWSIRELVALIAGARFFLGNDSGPAHIAAAAGVPVAVIFGSSHAAVWKPWGAAHSEVIQNPFDCNPCSGDRCHAFDEPQCILSVSTEQVKAAVARLLAE